MKLLKMYEDERKRREATEILKLAGCLDNIDDDVAQLCLELIPKEKDRLISIAELVEGVQKIKNKLKESLSQSSADQCERFQPRP